MTYLSGAVYCDPCELPRDFRDKYCCEREREATTGNPGPGELDREKAQCKKLENPWLYEKPLFKDYARKNDRPDLSYIPAGLVERD